MFALYLWRSDKRYIYHRIQCTCFTTKHYKGCKGKFNIKPMHDTKNLAVVEKAPSYQAKMSELRLQLRGRPYCNDVKELLPELSKATIHGAVNGRNENKLVLAALEIIVFKLDKAEQEARARLSDEAKKVGALV